MNVRKNVLVVEDVEMHRKILKTFLENDYNVLEASNGKEALKIIEKKKKNIMTILLDITMPVMDGYEFLERRLHDLDLLAIPVIVITDSSDQNCEMKVLNLGATDIMHKPYDPRIVSLRVKNVLQKYELDEMRVDNEYAHELEKTKQKLDSLIDNVMCGISIIVCKGKKLILDYANKTHLDMFSINDKDISKADVLKNINPQDLPIFLKAVDAAIESFDTFEAVYRYNYNDEDTSYFRTKIMKTKNPDSNDIYLLCITTDETKTVKLFNELNDSYIKMNTIFDNFDGGIGILEITDNLKFTYTNDGLFNMLGYSKDEPDLIKKIISPDEENKYLNALKKIEIGEYVTYNLKFVKKDFDDIQVLAKGRIVESMETGNKLFVALFIDLTQEKKMEEKIKYLIDYDDLTKLFNQKKYVEVTEMMLLKNPEKRHLLVLIDVFRFKNIQTIFGKKVADELLVIVADGLRKIIKYGARARIGSDVFSLCVLEEGFNIEELSKSMNEYLISNFKKCNVNLYFSVFILDDPYLPIDTAILRAQFALHDIKGNVFKNYVYCDSDVRRRAILKDEIQTEMFEGLSKKQFEVFVQPVVDLKTKEIISAEALVRWNHPKKGYIFPANFISVFEENGFIVNLDNFVWNEVAKLIRRWIDENKKVIPISVNVSRVDLYNNEFFEKIVNIVETHKIPSKYLRIEITESAYIINESIIGNTVKKLKDYGFTVLMDDFGSGYSSLNSLRDINFDVLKLDMKLIKDIENNNRSANILKSIIDMAKSLELPIIAEGVETEAQVAFLEQFGCNNAQGFLFSKAISIEEMEKMLNR